MTSIEPNQLIDINNAREEGRQSYVEGTKDGKFVRCERWAAVATLTEALVDKHAELKRACLDLLREIHYRAVRHPEDKIIWRMPELQKIANLIGYHHVL